MLLGGVDTPIDIDDWRAHTKYGGLFDNSHPTVSAFWSVRSLVRVALVE